MSDLVERIESELKKKGKTFRRLEHDCGLGNGTVKRWCTQSPRLDKLIIVADYLQVSLDYLVYGYDVPGSIERTLSEKETEFISLFRDLPPEEQEDFYSFLEIKHKRYHGDPQS